jgi:hypothetical protein
VDSAGLGRGTVTRFSAHSKEFRFYIATGGGSIERLSAYHVGLCFIESFAQTSSTQFIIMNSEGKEVKTVHVLKDYTVKDYRDVRSALIGCAV